MLTSTYSSSAPWSWTIEFDSDYDPMIVLAHSGASLGLQRYLSKREMSKVAMTSLFANFFWCLKIN